LNHRHAHAIPSSEPAQWMRNQNLQQQGMFWSNTYMSIPTSEDKRDNEGLSNTNYILKSIPVDDWLFNNQWPLLKIIPTNKPIHSFMISTAQYLVSVT
jgi:hypothetical protein